MPTERGDGYNVLVVDDDDGVATVLERLLAADGYAVRRARDGREALALAADRAPDLVLLDLDMPRLGGFDVCAALKADPAPGSSRSSSSPGGAPPRPGCGRGSWGPTTS